MVVTLEQNKYIHKDVLNNIARQQKYGIISGCGVTADSPVSMDVIVAPGTYLFNGVKITTAGDTVTLSAADATYNRYDLIVMDNAGNISALEGTNSLNDDDPALTGVLPINDYDPDTYLPIARVFVGNGVSTITTADIKDVRVDSNDSVGVNDRISAFINQNNFQLIQDGVTRYNELDNTYIEVFDGDTAGSTTNLTHNTDVDEYFSVTDGAYELETDLYQTEDSCSKCYANFDYSIYKEIDETDLSSSLSGTGTNSDTSTTDIISEKVITTKFSLTASPNSGSGTVTGTASLLITDGSNSSNILNISASHTSGGNRELKKAEGVAKIFNDTTNELIKVFLTYTYQFNEDVYQSEFYQKSDYIEIDYSGWSASNLYLGVATSFGANAAGGSSAVAKAYYQRAYKQNPSSTATISVSSDSGTTYDEVDNGAITEFTASGSNIKAKIAGTLAANEGITIKKVILKPMV